MQAAPVDSVKAKKVVKGWLKSDSKPLGTVLSDDIKSVDTYSNSAGETQYYVINLRHEGYVVVTADDELEPVIAFSSDGSYEPSHDNPLFSLVTRDTLIRNKSLRDKSNNAQKKKAKKQQKWNQLLNAADQTYRTYTSLSSVTDMRVAPFVQSRWSQGNVSGSPCYNYFTPPNQEPDGDSYNNYPCGCVATAMAQIMRYYEYPTTAIEYRLYDFRVKEAGEPNYIDYSAYPKGGDGQGGAYDWSNMPLVPGTGLTEAQRIAIGGICCDAGLSCDMGYTSSGSGATIHNAQRGLVNTFMYENVIHAWGLDGYGPAIPIPVEAVRNILNSNMDAKLPVMLGIYTEGSTSGGHAVVADGYGYDDGALYHHINMGWGGSADAWYNIPDISSYDAIDTMNYNIYPSGTGEIISGRITSDSGLPVEDVTVQALQGQAVIQTTTTDQYGIYAFSRIPSEQTFTITADKDGYLFNIQDVTVGLSEYDSPYNAYKCGNVCDVNFVGQELAGIPPEAYDEEVTVMDSNGATIVLSATDDGFPVPPGALSYSITSLPEHGWLFDPNDGLEIISTPYTLQNDGNSVIYEPCPYYFQGTDGFTFKANDGGTAPDGGDSNIADVNLVMNMLSDVLYEIDTIYKDYIPFMTGFKKVRSQALYHASELGGTGMTISSLALKIQTPPAIEIQNLMIRMKHAALDEYSTTAQFDNDGWTVVYDANETITEQDDWHEFVFDKPFTYDGANNLLIDFSFDNTSTSSGYGYVYDSATGTQYRIISYWSNSGNPLEFVSPNYKWKRLFNLTLKTQPDTETLRADFNYNCSVGTEDLMTMVDAWLSQQGDTGYNSACDISVVADNKVDIADFAVLASEWLNTIE